MTYIKGELFSLSSGNRLMGKVDLEPEIDDKTSSRHKVYLEKGEHELQLRVVRDEFDKWALVWLEFTEVLEK